MTLALSYNSGAHWRFDLEEVIEPLSVSHFLSESISQELNQWCGIWLLQALDGVFY